MFADVSLQVHNEILHGFHLRPGKLTLHSVRLWFSFHQLRGIASRTLPRAGGLLGLGGSGGLRGT